MTLQCYSPTLIPQPWPVLFRKDKYQKKLLWYWCDIAYEGVEAKKDEEELARETSIADGTRVTDVPFGLGSSLPNMDSDEDMDDAEDDEDDDEEEDEEGEDTKQPKLGKRKSKENVAEDLEEATTPKISLCAMVMPENPEQSPES